MNIITIILVKIKLFFKETNHFQHITLMSQFLRFWELFILTSPNMGFLEVFSQSGSHEFLSDSVTPRVGDWRESDWRGWLVSFLENAACGF